MRKVLDSLRWLVRSAKGHEFLFKGITTLMLASGSVLVLIPFLYMISTSLKDPAQIRSDSASLIPRKPKTAEINGNPEPLSEVGVRVQERMQERAGFRVDEVDSPGVGRPRVTLRCRNKEVRV